MKLFYSDASPYSRCVRLVIRHLGITGIDEVITNPLDNGEDLLEVNPLGKVPCLQLNDGSSLFDSEVILRYLDCEFGEGQLFGIREHNWIGESHFSLIKGLLDSADALRQEQMRQEEGKRSPFWTGRFEQALLRGLQHIEQTGLAMSRDLSIQQICLACLLEYIDFRHGELEWRKVAPALALWLSEFDRLPAMQATRPK
ncbi:glutathione S-transferase [Shewanella violacea]|uniref:Glutathione S-transferase family protein n=1 Tax=Shewanella violacea (strain JCM 10179 / CIP 106290 / LMG 19151 / DSS12) TaxID=637905 RepID=D4ZGE9_SHEVD|nr:glutathione S-transferase N-terminal domain-containing protein [Shewanella violacea]BAJ00748.1 glutathione S-transferase family protein [Shewanella violacea DSS12]